MLIRADALRPPIADGTVQTIVTSPPYPEQRYYGDDPRELGHEPTLEAFVESLRAVFAAWRPLLAPGGSLRLNLGDKANGSGGAGGDWTRGGDGVRAHRGLGAKVFRDPAYLDATWLDAPGAVLRALLLDRWRLRAEVVWQRGELGRPRLERGSYAHLRRPKVSHEKLYLLAPDDQPIRFFASMLEEEGTVWTFPPSGAGTRDGDQHLGPFPDELPRRCILTTTLPGDLVFDGFDGAGTTRRVAEELGRRGLGADLYAGVEKSNGQARTGIVDLKDLEALKLKPAVLYYACRRIAAGDLPALEKLDLEGWTNEQIEYLKELTS